MHVKQCMGYLCVFSKAGGLFIYECMYVQVSLYVCMYMHKGIHLNRASMHICNECIYVIMYYVTGYL